MKKSDYFLCILLSAIAFVSRMPLLEKFQSHWDGPQYSLAIIHYSFEQQTPGPPGYPFYIALGKFFHIFLPDIHSAILAVSVLGSVVGAVVLYIVGKQMYHRFVGLAASILFLTGSTFYYFGLTPYAYGLLPGTTALLAYSVYRIFIKHKPEGILFGIIAGICFGIRPQETIQIGPLILLGFVLLPTKEKMNSVFVFCCITLLWFIPISYTVGVEKYFLLSYNFAKTAIYHNSLSQHLELMAKGFLLSLGISSGFLFYFIWRLFQEKKLLKKETKILIFYSVWLVPGLFYNLFLRTEHAGYQMSYLTGILLLIAYALWKTTGKNKLLYGLALTVVAVFNLYWFFYNRDPQFIKPYRPTSFHYSDIRKNDLKVGSKVRFVQQKFDPKNTLIITVDVLWRPYMYHLKQYQLTDLTGLDANTPGYLYTRRDAKNWIMHEYEDKDRLVLIPSGITTIVITDDEAAPWIKNYPFKTYHLPGNSTVTAISVLPHTKMVYRYHALTILGKGQNKKIK